MSTYVISTLATEGDHTFSHLNLSALYIYSSFLIYSQSFPVNIFPSQSYACSKH